MEKVTLHRAIRSDSNGGTGLEIQGRVDSGRVALSDADGDIKIYIQRTDPPVNPFSLTLNQKLSEYLGLKKDDQTARAFSTVMMTDDHEEVQEELEKQGIWSAGYDGVPQEAQGDDSDTDDDEEDCEGHKISSVKGNAEDTDESSSFTSDPEPRTPRRNRVKSDDSPRAGQNRDGQELDPLAHTPSTRPSYPGLGSRLPLYRTEAKEMVSMEEIEKAMESCKLLDTTPMAPYEISKQTETSVGSQSTHVYDSSHKAPLPSPSSDDLLDNLARGVTAMKITSPSGDEDIEQSGSRRSSSDVRPNDNGLLTPMHRRSHNTSPGGSARSRKFSSSGEVEDEQQPYIVGLYGELFVRIAFRHHKACLLTVLPDL